MNRYPVLVFLFLCCFSLPAASQNICFSELNFNSDSTTTSGDWVELYNYGTETMDLSGWMLKDEGDLDVFVFPANTQLSAGARLVVVNDAAKFSTEYPFVFNTLDTLPFSFGNDGDQVRLLNAAGELQLFMEYADSTPWYPAADGSGRTLELLNASLDPNDPANWFVGCMKGSPGLPFSTCNDAIVFDEINYNSDTLMDAGDWIELWNRSGGNINLNGWSFKDSNNDNFFFFPTNTNLAPGARLVLVHDSVRFLERHPGAVNWIGNFDFNLSNDGELVRLYDFSGRLKFSIVFNDQGGGWPPGADGDGYTLELLNAQGNMNVASNWFTGCLEGSPGYAYDPDCNVGIANVPAKEFSLFYSAADETVYFSEGEWMRDQSPRVFLFDASGRKISESLLRHERGISVRGLSPGLYLAAIQTAQQVFTGKFIRQ